MGNCKDCYNWDSDTYTCRAWEYMDGYPESRKSPGDCDFKICVTALDDQGLEAGLKTGPNFGCVKYQFCMR